MLYFYLVPLSDEYGFLNLFRYISFRTGGATITALVLSFVVGPYLIRWLKKRQAGSSNVREDVPDQHLKKAGTPTMGGVLILFSMIFSTILWMDMSSGLVWFVLMVTLAFGIIGGVDDYLKLIKNNSRGLAGRYKLVLQAVFALIATYGIMQLSPPDLAYQVAVPFFKSVLLDFGWAFYLFALVVIVGSSNSVNLTDGLDGLAIVPVMICAACFALIAYLVGNAVYAQYLQLHFVPGTGEITIFCGAVIGAGLGFLWFNAPPAMVFMGDTGSLSLGSALGTISIATKHEIVLAIIGGLFVLETISVIVQVISFRLIGKRVFAMAPLHHHFEKKGWAESTIVVRFWIIAVILAIVGLSTLKLR